MGQGFRDLLVWQKAMSLVVDIYSLTRGFPREEQFGLTNQIRRSAVSIPSNLAEGQGRITSNEFRQFVAIARGSNYELQTQLELAGKLNLCDMNALDNALKSSIEIGKMLNGLIDSIG